MRMEVHLVSGINQSVYLPIRALNCQLHDRHKSKLSNGLRWSRTTATGQSRVSSERIVIWQLKLVTLIPEKELSLKSEVS